MNKDSKIFPKIILIIALLLILALVGLKISYDRTLQKSLSESEELVSIEITEGESVRDILSSLVEKGLLQKEHVYYTKLYLKLNKLETSLQAGIYQLPKQLSIVEIIESLQFGRSQDIWVLIPEGLRKDEIAEILERELSKSELSTFSKEEFLLLSTNSEYISTLGLAIEVNDLEGFLFPDRYAFPNDPDTESVIERLVSNFNNKVGQDYTYEEIVLASIVEREGFNGNDKPIIAGIIIKRYAEGWLLQTDATLLYPVKDWRHIITIQDKEDENPYNTYKYLGLPPTPICNPGLQSIEAVWDPIETNYYFYIHDKEKNPHYAETLDQHNNNVNKYLR